MAMSQGSLQCGPSNDLPKAALWGSRVMLSSKPCNVTGTIKLIQLTFGKYPRINRAVANDGELELQVFDAIPLPVNERRQKFTLRKKASFSISQFRNGPFNKILTCPLRVPVPIHRGQYVAIAIPRDRDGRLNISSRSTNEAEKQVIYYGKDVCTRIGNSIAYVGYKGSDTRGHSCSGFRVSVISGHTNRMQQQQGFSSSNTTQSSTNSNNSDNNDNAGGVYLFGNIATTAEWKTPFCMHLSPMQRNGAIKHVEVRFQNGPGAGTIYDMELHFFRKAYSTLWRFVKKAPFKDCTIKFTSPTMRKVIFENPVEVSKDMIVGLCNPTGAKLSICSRNAMMAGTQQTLLYNPQPKSNQYTQNTQTNVKFTSYSDTDRRGKTCPGYQLFIVPQQANTNSFIRPPQSQRQSSAEPNEQKISQDRSREVQGNQITYLGVQPLPYDMTANWRTDYMMSGVPVKKNGVVDGINIWLGGPTTTDTFYLKVFEKLGIGGTTDSFKLISSHDVKINKAFISTAQACKIKGQCRVKKGQYMCVCTASKSQKLNLRSRSKTIQTRQVLFYNPKKVGQSYQFRKYSDADHRGKSCLGFNVSIYTSSLDVLGPDDIATTTSWLSPTMTSREMIALKDGYIHSIRLSLDLPANGDIKWELHTMKVAMKDNGDDDGDGERTNRRHRGSSFINVEMVSTGKVSFQPPIFTGISNVPLDEPLKVNEGEYVALYSGDVSRPLHVHSQTQQRYVSGNNMASQERTILYGDMPDDRERVELWSLMPGDDTRCGFQVMVSKSKEKPKVRDYTSNTLIDIFERSPTDRCALALRDFTDAKSEKQLLFAIQTLASFNSAGITKQKLIQHAQWKMASKYDVWTRDVATLFGNCLSLKLENESKEDGGEDTRGRSVSVGIILENENENVNETDYDGDDNTQQQEEEEVQEQTIRQPTIFNVTAPPGTRAGQVIRVSTPRGIVQVAIPPGITAGMTFQMAVN